MLLTVCGFEFLNHLHFIRMHMNNLLETVQCNVVRGMRSACYCLCLEHLGLLLSHVQCCLLYISTIDDQVILFITVLISQKLFTYLRIVF